MPEIYINPDLAIIEEEHERHQLYRIYREYYDGVHDAQLTDRQRKYLQLKIGEEFNDNYFPVVADALSERLSITGIDADEQSGDIWQWYELNRGDALQAVVHSAAVRDGDAYILVEWNEAGLPMWSFEPAYDGTEGAEVVYSIERRDEPLFGYKRWQTGGELERLNIYYPERVEKYKGRASAWQLIEVLPWTDTGQEGGLPLGIPLIHFKNKDQGYKYGRSEVADVVPLQNALNKSIIDMVAAADTTAFRIFWMLGDDPEGIEITPGSWIYSEKSPNDSENGVSVGYFPGEDLTNLINFKDSFVAEIARVSRTPLSYFQMSGNVMAEGTLKQQEAGLVSRAKDRQVTFGNAWEDVFYLSRRLWNAFGSAPELPEEQSFSMLWADPETRNDAAFILMLKTKHELGVPAETLWGEMGYSAEKIEEFKKSPEYQARLAQLKMSIDTVSLFDVGLDG
jgi:hypothetical protein